jgi:excisionase family DNA binding protein
MTVDEVRLLLHCSDRSVVHLIDSGEIQAYRLLMADCATKWRINLPSVERYIAKLHRMAAPKQHQPSSSRFESSPA